MTSKIQHKAGAPDATDIALPQWHAWAVSWIARTCYATYRKSIIDPAHCRTRMQEQPFIFVCWHNRLLFAPFCIPPKIRVHTAALASHSRDGAYAAAYIKAFSGQAVRGSTSRGGYRAIIRMLQHLRDGGPVVITPDGPRGPRYTVQPGAVILAEKSGVPLVPVSINAPDRWTLKSWDGTQIPKPFSRITIKYGAPVVLADRPGEDRQAARTAHLQQVEQALMNVTDDFTT